MSLVFASLGGVARAESTSVDSLRQALPDTSRWFSGEDLAVAVDSLQLAPGQSRIDLREPVLRELLSVTLGAEALVEGEDYRILLDRGVLVLRRSPKETAPLVVRYRYEPSALVSHLVLRDATRPLAAPQTSRAGPVGSRLGVARRDGEERAALGDLQIRGSKTVSIRGGTNRDATVDQGLNLSIVGQLTEGIGVRAEISDENLPITPEGNTEELTDLDEVRIELFGERGRALLGDFRVDRDLGRFLPYDRKLQGLWLEGRGQRGTVQVLGGAPQGQRVEVEIRGREGVQGPYELLDGLRLQQTVIVAGSERVWVDGDLQVRGDSRDYVIDYVRGTITFNESRPIGPENRIAVDYEGSVAGYRRSVLGTLVDALRVGAVRIDVALMREGDDPNRPLSGTLGAEERAALAAAGDDPNGALSSGVRLTAPGEGDYVQRTADDGSVYYEIADSTTTGNYDLDFVFVGAGKGDYELLGVTETGALEFVWRGVGNGDYRVGRRLDLPEKTDYAVVRVGAGRVATGAGIEAELNASRHDANRLSDLDDQDNQGAAWRVNAASGWWGSSETAKGLRLRAVVERIERNFRSSGRLREPFFYDVWNLQDELRNEDETFAQAGVEWRGKERRVDVGFRRLDRGTTYQGQRWEVPGSGRVVGNLGWEHLFAQTTAERESGARSSRRDRRLRLKWKAGVWQPFVEARDEIFRDFRTAGWTGYRSGGWMVGLDGGADTRLEYSRDVADSLDPSGQAWNFERDTRLVRAIRSQNWSNTRARMDLTWRESLLAGDQRGKTRLARIQASHQIPDRGFRLDVDYRAGTDQSRVLGRRVIFVGLGQGDYDAEGNAVGAKQGDYNVVFTPTDSLVSSTEVEANIQLQMRSDFRWVAGLESRSLLQIRESSRSSDVGALLRLDPAKLRNPESTLFGQQRIREELHLLRQRRGIDLRLAFDRTDLLDQRFTQGPEESRRQESLAQLDVELGGGWSLGSQLKDEERHRSSTSVLNPQLRSYRVHDRVAASTLRLRTGPRRRYALELRYTLRDEDLESIRQTLIEARPSATTDWFGLNWTLEGRWSELTERAGPLPRRPFFFEAPGTTRSGSLRMQWASARGFSVALRYQLRDEAGRILRHDLGLETRARF